MHGHHGVGSWILGGAIGILALIGLVLAANAHDRTFYGVGLILFVFSCAFIFFLIKQAFDGKHR